MDDVAVNLRELDALFLLPRLPTAAAVTGADERSQRWKSLLSSAGLLAADGAAVDLHTGTSPTRRDVASYLLLGGRSPRWLAREHDVCRWMGVPLTGDPVMYVPTGSGAAMRYALRWLVAPATGAKAVRNRVLGLLDNVGWTPTLGDSSLVVASNVGRLPEMVEAARPFGVHPGTCLLLRGSGDALTRLTFLVFAPGQEDPTWAVKFGRTGAVRPTFDREEHGLQLVAQVPSAARHAPRLHGRFDLGGLPASIESAGVGEGLARRLVRTRGVDDPVIDQVADWLREVARDSAGPVRELDDLRRWLRDELLPEWPQLPGDMADALAHVPPVLGHRDLGTWNVVADAHAFTVLDWEGAHRPAFPLWDLLYFLTDAFAIADGAITVDERVEHARQLHLGELPASSRLFEVMHAAGADLGLDWPTVGRLATLCWLRHARSRRDRERALQTAASATSADVPVPAAGKLAEVWVKHPRLASTWDAGA